MPRPTSIALGLYYAATFAAFGFYLPYMPAWFIARGFVGGTMSALLMLLPAMAIVTPPLFGMLADGLGLRGGLLRVACLGAACAYALLALAAAHLSPLPFALAFACCMVFAGFRSAMSGLADVIALEHARHYGRMRLWGSVGFLGSAWLGGRFVDPTRPALLPACIALCLGVSFLIAQTLPRTAALPPRPAPLEARRLLAQRSFRWLLAGSFLITAAGSAYDTCLTLHLRDLGASGDFIGTAWALGTLAEILLMAWLSPHVARFGAARLLVFSYAVASLRWALLASVRSLPLLMVLQPLHCISFALMWISSVSLLKEETGDGALATAQGIFAAACALGSACGMASWGGLYATSGSDAVFTVASLLACFATLAGVALGRARRGAPVPVPVPGP